LNIGEISKVIAYFLDNLIVNQGITINSIELYAIFLRPCLKDLDAHLNLRNVFRRLSLLLIFKFFLFLVLVAELLDGSLKLVLLGIKFNFAFLVLKITSNFSKKFLW